MASVNTDSCLHGRAHSKTAQNGGVSAQSPMRYPHASWHASIVAAHAPSIMAAAAIDSGGCPRRAPPDLITCTSTNAHSKLRNELQNELQTSGKMSCSTMARRRPSSHRKTPPRLRIGRNRYSKRVNRAQAPRTWPGSGCCSSATQRPPPSRRTVPVRVPACISFEFTPVRVGYWYGIYSVFHSPWYHLH